MTDSNTQTPDLLRRFVATPFSATIFFDGSEIALQTNDMNLMSTAKAAGQANVQAIGRTIRMTLVRDEDAPGHEADVTVISAGPLRTVFAGTGTTLTVDAERGEVFAFLARSISADRFVRELLPMTVKLLVQSSSRSCL